MRSQREWLRITDNAYMFTTLQGNPFRCVYPKGEDPLLQAWREGKFFIHPKWGDSAHLDHIIAEAERKQS